MAELITQRPFKWGVRETEYGKRDKDESAKCFSRGNGESRSKAPKVLFEYGVSPTTMGFHRPYTSKCRGNRSPLYEGEDIV